MTRGQVVPSGDNRLSLAIVNIQQELFGTTVNIFASLSHPHTARARAPRLLVGAQKMVLQSQRWPKTRHWNKGGYHACAPSRGCLVHSSRAVSDDTGVLGRSQVVEGLKVTGTLGSFNRRDGQAFRWAHGSLMSSRQPRGIQDGSCGLRWCFRFKRGSAALCHRKHTTRTLSLSTAKIHTATCVAAP